MSDIENRIYQQYGFANRLRLIWQATVAIATRKALTVEEKKLLAEAARHEGGISQSETAGFKAWRKGKKRSVQEPVEYRSVMVAGRPGEILRVPQPYTDAPYIAALTKLQQRGLIRQASSRTSTAEDNPQITMIDFVLTREGWWAGLAYARKKYTLKKEIVPI